MPMDAFALPFRKPSTRNRFWELPLPGADSSARHVFHARKPDAGPSVEAPAPDVRPSPSPPANPHRNLISGPTGLESTGDPAELRERARRLLDLNFLAGELKEGRGDLLLESFRAVRRALVQAGEGSSQRPAWAARFVSRKSKTIWDPVRIEREIRRIWRRPSLPDRLREMEAFIGREWIPLTRYAGLPGFLHHHHRRCVGNRTGTRMEPDSTSSKDAILFRKADYGRDYRHFPALIGALDTGPGEIVAAAATSNGDRLLTLDPVDGAVLRCGITGRLRQTLTAPDGRTTAVDLSRDGKRAAIGHTQNGNGQVTVCDTRNRERTFSAPCAEEFQLSGDGRHLLWRHPSGHLLRKNLQSPESPRVLWESGQWEGPLALAISNDGRWAVSARRSLDSVESPAVPGNVGVGESPIHTEDFQTRDPRFSVQVWDLESGRRRHRLPVLGSGVRFLALSADGRRVAAVDEDRGLRIWDRRTGQSRGRMELPKEKTTALAMTPDGRYGVAAHSMGSVSVWDLRRRCLVKTMQTHFGSIRKISIVRDGKRAFTLGGDGRIRLVDIRRGESEKRPVHRSVQFLETGPDGNYAVGAGCLRFHRREIRIWDLAEGTPTARRIDLPALPFRDVHISPRGNLALTVQPGSVQGWGIPSGSPEFQWKFDEPERIARGLFAGDGERVVLLAREQYLFVGEPGDRRPSILAGDVIDMTPFPDSRHLLTLAGDRGLEIWNLQRRVRVGRLAGSRDVRKMVLSPGGNFLAEITRRGLVRLRSLRTGGTFFPLGGRILAEPQIQFSPDDRRLVVAAEIRNGESPSETRLFSVDLSGGDTREPSLGVVPISLPFRRPLLRITPNGEGIAAAEPVGREILLIHLETGEPVDCLCIPADSAPLAHLGDFGAQGVLPAALQDGRVVFFGVGQGYEKARPVSPFVLAETRAWDRRREVRQIAIPQPEIVRDKKAPPIPKPRRTRRKRPRQVLDLPPELRVGFSIG